MAHQPSDIGEEGPEDDSRWSLRDRLELLAFEARLAVVPQALLEVLWEVMDRLDSHTSAPPWEARRRVGRCAVSLRDVLQVVAGTASAHHFDPRLTVEKDFACG